VKFCLSFEKTAPSTLIFVTLGYLVAISPAQAAPDLNITTASKTEFSNPKFSASTDLPIQEMEVIPATNQSNVTSLATPDWSENTSVTSLATPDSRENTSVKTNEIAVETSNPPTDATPVELTTPTPVVEAQALPLEVATPQESLSATEDDPMEQVTNVSQLSDVRPSDWAYEALRSLVERYGCIAGYPDGSFRGNRAMSRFEFAAGLNSCSQQIEKLVAGIGSNFATRGDLETLQRLVNEFRPELATLGTRLDTLESRTARLEERQFSTTTKLFGQAIVGIQGRSENSFDFFPPNRLQDTGTNINLVDSVQLSLFTQFSPRSLLITGLAAGNGNNNATRLAEYTSLGYESGINNNLEISDLNYRQLIGSKFALIVGPVGVNPVNVFRGVNRIESAGSGSLSRFGQRNPIINIGGGGGGIGFDWQLATRVSLQGVYSANRPEDPSNGGIFGGNNGGTTIGAQLVVSPTDKIDVSLQYLNSYSPSGRLGTGVGDDLLVIQNIDTGRAPIQTNAVGASIEWRVTPRFTLGGWGGYTTSDFKGGSGSVETFNWMAFLNFPDLLGQGNLGGIYFGQPPKITGSDVASNGAGRNIPSFVNRGDFFAGEGGQPDTTLHLEGFYRFRVTDNISVTPGVIVIFNPNQNSNNDTITIGALRTTFTF
jgi:hypothetical protein